MLMSYLLRFEMNVHSRMKANSFCSLNRFALRNIGSTEGEFFNATAYKDTLDNRVLPTLLYQFNEDTYGCDGQMSRSS